MRSRRAISDRRCRDYAATCNDTQWPQWPRRLGDENVHRGRGAKVMSGNTLVALEVGLIFVAVVGWGVWELYKLKKGR